MTFESFIWGPHLMTHIAIIDSQHQHLVKLINQLGEVLLGTSQKSVVEIIAEIRGYAGYHFHTEEKIWSSAGLDLEEQNHHQEKHLSYITQLDYLLNDFSGRPDERATLLHAYLSSWLIFHILGEDHEMVRQLQAISPAGPAVESVTPQISANSLAIPSPIESVLLTALHSLYTALTTINAQLHETNLELDARVHERTQALESTNEALIKERDLLAETNFELDETRSQLLRSEKLASIGQLAAGVAHEINNPIGFVNSNLGTLGEYLDDAFAVLDAYAVSDALIARDPQAIAAVRAIKAERKIAFVREDASLLLAESRNGLLRVKKIVQDLKIFSHVDHTEWGLSDLHAGMESTINIAWNELRQKAELRRELGDIPKVWCHAGQLNQVFMNLLINATQAIDDHGVITVRTSAVDGEDGAEVWVEVEDDGCGISPEHQSRIFEPFFTTKPVGKGTGLGLSVAWGIVKKHGGRIEVDSAPGRGTRFRVCLPVNGSEKITKSKDGEISQ